MVFLSRPPGTSWLDWSTDDQAGGGPGYLSPVLQSSCTPSVLMRITNQISAHPAAAQNMSSSRFGREKTGRPPSSAVTAGSSPPNLNTTSTQPRAVPTSPDCSPLNTWVTSLSEASHPQLHPLQAVHEWNRPPAHHPAKLEPVWANSSPTLRLSCSMFTVMPIK